MTTDKQVAKWIRQIQRRNDQQAADQLIAHFYREIYAYVYRQTSGKDEALDVTQEVFISMLRTMNHYDATKASFRTWLYRIATNRVIDYFRSRQHRMVQRWMPLEEQAYQAEDDFTIQLEEAERWDMVLQQIAQLDQTSQFIFRLRLIGEYTFAEIADQLEMPETTIKSRYYQMIKKLRQEERGQ